MKLERYKDTTIIQAESKGFFENRDYPIKIFASSLDQINKILKAAFNKVSQVCVIGSSCMYPDKNSALIEEDLGTGAPYPNNALFSYSQLLSHQLCKTISEKHDYQYYTVVPSDIFGPPHDTHFIAQIMRRMHEAKQKDAEKISCFGTGMAVRHPLYDEDFERVLLEIIENYKETGCLNLAPPVSYAKKISSIVLDIKEIVGFKGDIEWDASYSDGQKVKVLDTAKLKRVCNPSFTPWMESLEKTYERLRNQL